MTCDRCEDLMERIRWLEEELGLQQSGVYGRIVANRFTLTPTEAWIVMILWKAKGRTVDRHWLLDHRPTVLRGDTDGEFELNTIRVYVSKIRKLMNGDYIKTEWGKGYYMSPEGVKFIDDVVADGLKGTDDGNTSGRREVTRSQSEN